MEGMHGWELGDMKAYVAVPMYVLRPGRTEGPPEPQASTREIQVDSGRCEGLGDHEASSQDSLLPHHSHEVHINQPLLTRSHLSQESLVSISNPDAASRRDSDLSSSHSRILPPVWHRMGCGAGEMAQG